MTRAVYRFVRLCQLFCASALLAGVAATTSVGSEVPAETVPNPRLSAEDVVRIQLGALAANDSPYPDAGIEITFRFASPANRRVTGPLPRFAKMVKNPVYSPMINHTFAEYGQSTMQEGRVLLPVMLTTAGGGWAAYVFILGRQEGEPCDRCWMTESVMRLNVDGIDAPPGRDVKTGA